MYCSKKKCQLSTLYMCQRRNVHSSISQAVRFAFLCSISEGCLQPDKLSLRHRGGAVSIINVLNCATKFLQYYSNRYTSINTRYESEYKKNILDQDLCRIIFLEPLCFLIKVSFFFCISYHSIICLIGIE